MAHENRPTDLDVAVIGAGVVGLAVARSFALAGREVAVLEAEAHIASHASSRNSEVIHAGIYYPTGSLKARLCVQGKEALYAYCRTEGVQHARLGKLIVATRDEEIPVLEQLRLQAERNGVRDLEWLDPREVAEIESELTCVRALLSPSTGIVDSHGLVTALSRDARRAGADIIVSSPVVSGLVCRDGIQLSGGVREPYRIMCRTVINAAGLGAPAMALAIEGLPKQTVPAGCLSKGHYFLLTGPSPFSHLIYPVPQPGGLGIHVTLDLDGRVRFGPDASWVDRVDYRFDRGREPLFVDAIRRYYPGLAAQRLQPGYTGIRAKVEPTAGSQQDFVVHGAETHGVRGLVNLFGIESPGLTASLSLAEHVRSIAE
jgi:L-2-hydroxyglutarate oxidase LhgO